MIKLLRLRKLIWGILVIIEILLEMVIVVPIVFLVFIYNFRFNPRKVWEAKHSADLDFQNKWGGYAYRDHTPWDTFKRRYKYTFNHIENESKRQ